MYNSHKRVIRNFSHLRALVIGDIMVDSYYKGRSNRICREAPVPIVSVEKTENTPGGAGNTALNLAGLGAQVNLLSVCGEDTEADTLIRLFQNRNIDTTGIIKLPNRKTLAKKRVMADSQLLIRFDYGSTEPIPAAAEKKMISHLLAAASQTDVVVISDYGYGVLTPSIITVLGQLIKQFPKPVIVDAKTVNRFKNTGVTAVKPNYDEFVGALGLERKNGEARVEQVTEEGSKILDITGARIAAVTIDSEGAVIFERGKKPFRTYTAPSVNSKAAGAGDTYISAMALALGIKADTVTAMEIAAAAASIVVHKDGTSVCSQDELLSRFMPKDKILKNTDELDIVCRSLKGQNRKLVFTNGYFDILHAGHIGFLEEAKKRGDILIIGVNSDESVRRLRGKSFPINPAADRMKILAALKMVDYVISFSENTALRLIETIRPEVYVKGGTYTRSTLIETQFIEEIGGRVEILPYFVPGNFSVTAVTPNELGRRYAMLL